MIVIRLCSFTFCSFGLRLGLRLLLSKQVSDTFHFVCTISSPCLRDKENRKTIFLHKRKRALFSFRLRSHRFFVAFNQLFLSIVLHCLKKKMVVSLVFWLRVSSLPHVAMWLSIRTFPSFRKPSPVGTTNN